MEISTLDDIKYELVHPIQVQVKEDGKKYFVSYPNFDNTIFPVGIADTEEKALQLFKKNIIMTYESHRQYHGLGVPFLEQEKQVERLIRNKKK